MQPRRDTTIAIRRAARLRALVDALGDSGRRRMADLAEVKVTYVRDLCSGRGGWSDERIPEIERMFGVPRGFFDSRSPIPARPFPIASRADLQAWLGSDPAPEPDTDTVPWVSAQEVMAFLSGAEPPARQLVRDTTLPAHLSMLAMIVPKGSPAPLETGDLAIFVRGAPPSDGHPVLAYVAGRGVLIRRYRELGIGPDGSTSFQLTSPDPEVAALTVRSGADGQLLGVLLQLRRNYDLTT